MAHLDEAQEAVEVQPAEDDAAALDALDLILAEEDGEIDTPEEDEEPDGDEPEDEVDDEEEQEAPAIPPPVSFNAEEKAVFETMTPEQQQAVAAIETRRNADVQKATTAAAEAKRNAVADAQAELVQIQRSYAEELAQYASAFEVQEPDYLLITTNPVAFAEQMAYYKQMTAQRDRLAQQSSEALRHAQATEQQNQAKWEAEQADILAREVPEWNDQAQRVAFVQKITEAGLALGFTAEQLSNVDASEIIALRQIATDREKAEKYDKLMSEKMSGVRAMKGKPAPISVRPGVTQSKGSGQRRATNEAMTRLRSTGSDSDAVAALAALGF